MSWKRKLTERGRVYEIIRHLKRQKFDVSAINIDELGDLSKITEREIIRKAKVTKETTKGGRLKKSWYKDTDVMQTYGVEIPEKPVFSYSKKTIEKTHDVKTTAKQIKEYYKKNPEKYESGKKEYYHKLSDDLLASGDVVENFENFLLNWVNPFGENQAEYYEWWESEYQAIYDAFMVALSAYGYDYVAQVLSDNAEFIAEIMDVMNNYKGSYPDGFASRLESLLSGEPITMEQSESRDYGQGEIEDEE